jgi:hypothetical protein
MSRSTFSRDAILNLNFRGGDTSFKVISSLHNDLYQEYNNFLFYLSDGEACYPELVE